MRPRRDARHPAGAESGAARAAEARARLRPPRNIFLNSSARAMVEAMPFPIASIQVDGGSEFMADFEQACEALRTPLHVLPPRRPQWNGCVERANRSARIEFWNRYDGPLTVSDIAPRLIEHEFFHNYLRPHTALDCRTPNEYLIQIEQAA